MAITPGTAHQNALSCSTPQPRVAVAAPISPVDSVTCRTCKPRPKPASSSGTRPNRKPSEILPAMLLTLARHQMAQRAARSAPSTARMRGFQRRALSSRCSTKAFSVHPATTLEANSSTPVNTANKGVGPSRDSEASSARACAASSSGAPNSHCAARPKASAAGNTRATLPNTPAACERVRAATSSTKACAARRSDRSASLSAMAGAVIAGCLVAMVQCSRAMSTKVAA